jgi:DNA-binding PadR family transcriptional regulator
VTEILTLLEDNSEMRFSEIMKRLKKEKDPPLKNAAALSYRLRALEIFGLITNNTQKEKGKQIKIFYKITDDGRRALTHLKMLENIVRK